MSGNHYSAPTAKKHKLSYNYNEQQHTGGMSAGDQINCSYIEQEKIEKQQQFQVLDEVNEGSNHEHTNSSDEESKDIPEEEINRMMEEGISDHSKTGQENLNTKDYSTRIKYILEDKLENPFEMLPVDWIKVQHASGMPVYMHRATRVCTVSKPYFIGTGNVQRHDIPMGAIPCYAYRRALEEEAKRKLRDQRIDEQIRNCTWTTDGNSMAIFNDRQRTDETPETAEHIKFEESIKQEVSDDGETEVWVTNEDQEKRTEQANASVGDFSSLQPVVLPEGVMAPSPKVEADSWQNQQLTPEQIYNYCKTLFHFKPAYVLRFKTWAARRRYYQGRRRTPQHSELPQSPEVINILDQAATDQNNIKKRLMVNLAMNMDVSNPGYLAMFHQYVRSMLHTLPTYELTQPENPSTPYQATVYIKDIKYGVGQGHSKRWAKTAAAQASIHILVPEVKVELDKHAPHSAPAAEAAELDYTVLDSVNIEDPRVIELCHATYEPLPYAILNTCLLRKFGVGQHINIQIKKTQSKEIELIMKVGTHTSTFVSNNRKIAKQRAAQSILQMLHPQVRSWGSLLRMYGSHTDKTNWEKRDQQHIFELQAQGCRNEPKTAVLGKLRGEMRKLQEKDASGGRMGTLQLGCHLPWQSDSNLVDL